MRGITAGLLMLGKTRVVEIMEGIDRALGAVRAQRRHDVAAGSGRSPRRRDRRGRVLHGNAAGRPHRSRGTCSTTPRPACASSPKRSRSRASRRMAHGGDHARTVVIEPHVADGVALRRPSTSPPQCSIRATVVRPKHAPRQARGHAAPAPKPVDREIDPEFLELFIEEAKDEIAKLKQLFPLWDENPQDQDALVNVRRSFHTLKGSGRMVGAQLIGEFAWSVENLLNRVINKTLERTPDMMTLLREAVAAVPELVEQLETGAQPASRHRAASSTGSTTLPACGPARRRRLPERAGAASCRSACCAGAASAVAHADHHGPALASQSGKKNGAPDIKPPPPSQMDPGLHEIYAKETAGHLATIREFIAACDARDAAVSGHRGPASLLPHAERHGEDGRRAPGHQDRRAAESLRPQALRQLHRHAGRGARALKDAVAAIQQVVDHIKENTGFFLDHPRIAARLGELEHELDDEISRLAETLDATMHSPAPAIGSERRRRQRRRRRRSRGRRAGADRRNALSMLDWSYDNFPPRACRSQVDELAVARRVADDDAPGAGLPDDPTRARRSACPTTTRTQRAAGARGRRSDERAALAGGRRRARARSPTRRRRKTQGIVVEEGDCSKTSRSRSKSTQSRWSRSWSSSRSRTGARAPASPSKTCWRKRSARRFAARRCRRSLPTVAVAPPPPRPAARCSGSTLRRRRRPRRLSRKRTTAPTSIPRSQRSSPKKPPSCSRPPIRRCHRGSRIAATTRWSSS